MAGLDLAAVPEQHRENVGTALAAAFGAGGASAVQAVTGGASGALVYRVETRAGAHLLRVEGIGGPLRNAHQYTCMQTAAEAGIAPPIRYLDADAGVVVMPYLTQRPLTDFPGGPAAVAAAAGALLARLHDSATFPAQGDYLDNLGRMLAHLVGSGRVAPGLLDRHTEGFEQIRAAYPWQPETFVSAHNDPNQFNLLYDGDRLWLVDWETAARNDPLTDLATVRAHLATTPDLRAVLLRSWLGREADPLLEAKLTLMGRLIQLYAGCILLVVVVDPATTTHTDLTPLSMDEFRNAIERGDLRAGTPAATHAYAKIALAAFADGLSSPDVADALRVAAG